MQCRGLTFPATNTPRHIPVRVDLSGRIPPRDSVRAEFIVFIFPDFFGVFEEWLDVLIYVNGVFLLICYGVLCRCVAGFCAASAEGSFLGGCL